MSSPMPMGPSSNQPLSRDDRSNVLLTYARTACLASLAHLLTLPPTLSDRVEIARPFVSPLVSPLIFGALQVVQACGVSPAPSNWATAPAPLDAPATGVPVMRNRSTDSLCRSPRYPTGLTSELKLRISLSVTLFVDALDRGSASTLSGDGG